MTKSLADRFVDKSIEAFIMGIEIYNKPTIQYRIEGFSFFACNAWELMLKAKLLNDGKSIYYADTGRTISLIDTVGRVYTDIRQPLRINLEKIIELRNISTHYITEEYESIYVPFFQSCVKNFAEQLLRFHKRDITEYIAQNFLTLSVNFKQLTNEEIRGKYSKEIAEKFISNRNDLNFLQEQNQSESLYIPIIHNFHLVKQKDGADYTFKFAKEGESTARTIKELQDPRNKYKLSFKNTAIAVNEKLKKKRISFNYRSSDGESTFNSHTLTEFINYYNVKDDSRYTFEYWNTHRYSYQLVEFIIDEIKKNPNLINDIKEVNKKR